MRILSVGEASSLDLMVKTGGKREVFRKLLGDMEINEALFISTDEWKYRNAPSTNFFKSRGMKFSVRQLKDKSGWAIFRTK